MKRIATDVAAFHFGLGDLDVFLIDGGVENRLDLQPGRGHCGQVDDRGMVLERPAAPVLRNVAEQAMLDLCCISRCPADHVGRSRNISMPSSKTGILICSAWRSAM
jgi:hypothetical protein